MAAIRAFTKDDVPAVTDLHMRVFQHSTQPPSAMLTNYFEEIFLRNPWCDDAIPSLVYHDQGGTIQGFMGVVPRPMFVYGQPMRAAVPTQLMVDPDSRAQGIAMQLVQTFLDGPQDLSLMDRAVDAGRRVFERAGSTLIPLYSLRWTRLLRPGGYVTSLLGKPGAPGKLLAWATKPCCDLVDTLVARLPQSPLRQAVPSRPDTDLTIDTLVDCFRAGQDGHSLWPAYDAQSLQWLFAMLSYKKRYGTLCKAVVYDAHDERIGWYLYYLNPGGVSEVIQIGAAPHALDTVLDHLFYHAWQQGAAALSGRLEPRLMRALSDQHCLFKRGYAWMLTHARTPELRHVIQQEDAFLTRLEGEWWMAFEDL
jgi:GNAT superfamily N-acetyltransferase